MVNCGGGVRAADAGDGPRADHAKPSLRKGGGGFIIALGMVFASVFDPAKVASLAQLDRHK